MNGSSLTVPRWHWKHAVIRIISPALLTLAFLLGLIFGIIVPTLKQQSMERKQEMIRQLTLTVGSELSGLQEAEQRGAISPAAAQADAIARIQKLGYGGDGKDYFWISGAEIRQMTRRAVQISLVISVLIAALLAYISLQELRLEQARWRVETALRASEEKYRLLVEETSEGVLLVAQDRPLYANKPLLARLGYTEEELLQLPLEKVLVAVPRLGSSAPEAERRATLCCKQGERMEVLLTSARVTVGDKAGQIFSVKEVAARKKTEATLTRLVADLQSLLPLATRPIKASPLPLVTCAVDTPISQAAAAMAQAKCSAIVVQSATGEAIGIVTDQDLRDRVLAVGQAPSQTVATIMSAPLIRIQDRALLFEAARLMQERKVHHLVVADAQGRTLGILNGAEILHAQRHAIGALVGEIQAAQSLEELRDSRAKLPIFIKALLESGARVEHITRILSTVSDAVLARLIVLAEAEIGSPPVGFAFVVLGSEAREEQTLATDQDNAVIYADVPADQNESVHAYFLRLGEKVCGGLDFVGYRRCPGGVMACNRKWCQPLSAWRRYFTECVHEAEPQDLLDVNVVFDFRCAYGEAELVRLLREHLHGLLQGEQRHTFFFHLAQSTLRYKPPRGFFGHIQLDSSHEHPTGFNIKAAIIPLVNFARLYALQQGFAETNTIERLHRLRDLDLLLPSSHDELVQAYSALMQMRLTHQATQIARGVAADNYLDLQGLSQLERSVLKKVFADITVFQARLQTDFARTA